MWPSVTNLGLRWVTVSGPLKYGSKIGSMANTTGLKKKMVLIKYYCFLKKKKGEKKKKTEGLPLFLLYKISQLKRAFASFCTNFYFLYKNLFLISILLIHFLK